TTIEHDDTQTVHHDRTITVDGKHTETICGNTSILIETGTYAHNVAANKSTCHVHGILTEQYDADQNTTVGGVQTTSVKKAINITSETANIHVQAATKIEVVVGSSSLTMNSAGKIDLKGTDITIHGTDTITLDSAKIALTGGSQASMSVGTQTV